MVTFVINLHNGIPGMALAEPFLYSLRRRRKLHTIFPAADRTSRRLEEALLHVRKQLETGTIMQWQVVFLIKIAADQPLPYKHSVSAHMMLIRKLFLEGGNLSSQPQNTYLLAVDHVNKDEAIPAINIKPYNKSWELDTSGMIGETGGFFITPDQMKALDGEWQAHINVAGEIINQGFERLSPTAQTKVNQTIQSIGEKVELMFDTDTINFNDYEIDKGINYLTPEVLNAIKYEFFKRLNNIKKDPSRYAAFLPSETLESCIREHSGIFSDDNDQFRLLRFSATQSQGIEFQRMLLKLAVIINLLANNEPVIGSLSKKNYTVGVKLNDERLKQVVYDQMVHLHNVETRLSDRLNQPAPASMAMIKDSECSCSETLDKKEPEAIGFGFMRQNGDLKKWDSWNDDIVEQLERYDELARKKIKSCIHKTHRKQPDTTAIQQFDIDERLDELSKKQDKLKERTEQGFLAANTYFDWNAFRRERELTLKPKLFRRPNSREVVYLIIAATLIFTLGFADATKSGEAMGLQLGYYGIIALIAVGVCMLAYYFAKKRYMKPLNRLLLEVTEKARERRMNINDNFERQKEYLETLCGLSTVRQNHEAVERLKEVQRGQNVLLNFHLRKLDEHGTMARQTLRMLQADEQGMRSSFTEGFPEPDIEKPVFESAIYAPETFIRQNVNEKDKLASVENIGYGIESPLGEIVSGVAFNNDRIYARNVRV